MTLRITREMESCLRATLRLEGSLVAEWADLLEYECACLRGASVVVRIDLTGVRFVDQAGIRALVRLSRSGIEIHSGPGAVASVLEGEGIHVEQSTLHPSKRRTP